MKILPTLAEIDRIAVAKSVEIERMEAKFDEKSVGELVGTVGGELEAETLVFDAGWRI